MIVEAKQAGPSYFEPLENEDLPGPSRCKRTDKEELLAKKAKRPKIIGFGSDSDQEFDVPDNDPFSDEEEKEWRDTFPKAPDPPMPELVLKYRRVLKHLPTVPNVKITCSDSSRVYLRILPEKEVDVQVVPKRSYSLLGVSFQQLRRQAKVSKNRFQSILAEVRDTTSLGVSESGGDLWVEKYKPKNYLDLLSEETLNRNLLHWLKLWDKSVFGSDYLAKHKVTKEKYAKLEAKEKEKEQFGFMKQLQVDDDEYDESGRPKQKVALLHGPPGLGKTTCAHIVARHAGYNVTELNASDDRSIEVFRKTLDSTTQNRTEVFQDGRPSCLIIDEIDGAPTDTVNILIDLITGKATEKGKKKLKKVLRRPVICICNDLYAPALKTLRQLAVVLNFPPLPVSSLVDRMKEVSLKEDLTLDAVTLHRLAEKTDCDIRSCLSSMQFLKNYKGSASGSDSQDIFNQIARKDKNKGIFAVWNEIFNLPHGKKDVGEEDRSRPSARFSSILSTVQSFGDYEKLQSGVFENYLKCKFRDSYFQSINDGLRWLNWFETLRHRVEKSQNYSLYPYLPMYFVNAHFLYASKNTFKLSYPSIERVTRTTKCRNTVKSQLSDMSPNVGRYLDEKNMITDVIPSLMTVIQPGTIRPIPTQLWNHRERETVSNIVSTMISYNLCYVQQKQEDGTYAFSLEPNIKEIAGFALQEGVSRTQFPYTVKQLVAQEINLEKVRRHEFEMDANGSSSAKSTTAPPAPDIPMEVEKVQQKEPTAKSVFNRHNSVPNVPHKAVKNVVQPKDFFGRPIMKSAAKIEEEKRTSGDIWYKFKEGYSNAVRRNLKLKDFV